MDEFFWALPSEYRHISRLSVIHDKKTVLFCVTQSAINIAVDADERAVLIRSLLQALPYEESHLVLPDGSEVSISGHAVDRLMTHLNRRSPIIVLRWLHSHTQKLKPIKLPILVEVSKSLKYQENAVHWRYFNEWTLVVSDGIVVTAYFRKLC